MIRTTRLLCHARASFRGFTRRRLRGICTMFRMSWSGFQRKAGAVGSSPTNANGRRSLRRVRLPDGISDRQSRAPIAQPNITTTLANATLKLTGANVKEISRLIAHRVSCRGAQRDGRRQFDRPHLSSGVAALRYPPNLARFGPYGYAAHPRRVAAALMAAVCHATPFTPA